MPRQKVCWGVIPGAAGPNIRRIPANAISIFYTEDGCASTASTLIEDEMHSGPIPTGVLSPDGEQIFRFEWRDTVPVGFHYTPDQYDEDGDFIPDYLEVE